MKTYPVLVNGWNYLDDPESMSYYKVFGKHVEVICLLWLDTVRGDEGYNEEGDAWIGVSADGNSIDDAEEMLNIMPCEITEVGRRVEAEKWLIEYMKTH